MSSLLPPLANQTASQQPIHSASFPRNRTIFIRRNPKSSNRVMNPSENMEEYLHFIEAFADTMASTFKQFAFICRDHLKKSQNNRSEFSEMRDQLIEQRKKRMELEDKIRQLMNPNSQSKPPNPEERKRPSNAFALFVADQRDKILAEYPSLNFSKVTALAAIKWKKLTEEQKKIYEKKFEEMNKLYDEQLKMQRNQQLTANNEQSEPVYVKREDVEPSRQMEDEQPNKLRGEEELNNQRDNKQPHKERQEKEIQNYPPKSAENQQEMPPAEIREPEAGATLMIANQQENQATLPMEPEKPVEVRPLDHLLNLFHTPVSQHPPRQQQQQQGPSQQMVQQERPEQPHLPGQKVQDSSKVCSEQQIPQAVQQKGAESMKSQEKVTFDPSIQIISQVVIDPTIQQQPK